MGSMMRGALMKVLLVALQEGVTHAVKIAEAIMSEDRIEDTELYERMDKTRRILASRAQRKIRQAEKGLTGI